MNREQLLAIWLESEPTAKSPYGIYGYPPMWETIKQNDKTLFTRPCKTMERVAPFAPYTETDGINYQWLDTDGKWLGQGHQCTFEYFETLTFN